MAGSSRAQPDVLKAKVCLVGDNAVGKTSLVRRYVLDQFDDKYLATLGAKVTKKEVRLEDPKDGGPVDVDLTIWDIMGQPTFRDLLRDAYFRDVQAVLAVADVTRRDTLDDLPEWVDAARRTAGTVPVVVAANKADLSGDAAFGRTVATRTAEAFGADVFLTSAKTGANVDAAFRHLASRLLEFASR